MGDQTVLKFEYIAEENNLSAKNLRNIGNVPGIVYGSGEETKKISLLAKDLRKALELPSIFSQVILLEEGETSHKVILKAVQTNPANDNPIHVDFMKVSSQTMITMQVPLKFINEESCIGVKNQGGMISKNRNEIELTCMAEVLPEFIEVDIAELELGNSIMQTGLILPEGVELSNTLSTSQDQPVVSCSTTRATLDIDESDAELSEGEEGVEGDSQEGDSEAPVDTEEENNS